GADVVETGNAQRHEVTGWRVAGGDRARNGPGVGPGDRSIEIDRGLHEGAILADRAVVRIRLRIEGSLGGVQVHVREVATLLMAGGIEHAGAEIAEVEQRLHPVAARVRRV